MPESPTPQQVHHGPGRQRIGAGVAVVAASAVAVGLVLGAGPSSSQGASKPTKSSAAATVARRDLVSTDTVSGTLGYANPETVFSRVSGTITSLPAVGAVVNPGQTLYTVDSAPVVLFNGRMPAYRELSAGVSNGLDVLELKQNLKTLGFDPSHQITVNQTFDAATTTAVDRWQASIGHSQTGTVTLGQIVFLPGPQRITKVDTVLGSTGGASGGSTGASAASSASTVVAASRAEFVSLIPTKATTPTTSTPGSGNPSTCPTTGTSTPQTPAMRATAAKIAALCSGGTGPTSVSSKQTLAALIALLKAETLLLQRSGASSSAGKTGGTSSSSSAALSGGARTGGGSSASGGAPSASGGAAGGGAAGGSSASGGSVGGSSASGGAAGSGSASGSGTAQAILQTTSTQLVVSVNLDATKQSEAVVGEGVTVQLPSGNTVDGKITGVSPVAQSASSSSSGSSAGAGGGGSSSSTPSSTVPISITLSAVRAATGLDQAAVSVNFQQQVEKNVLSVPVTALLATSGGGYAVQAASAPHPLIPVTPGLFASGFVQVSGAGIYSGLQITDSQG